MNSLSNLRQLFVSLLSRRNFLKYSALSILGLSFGCKDDPASPKPDPEPEPTTELIAKINAPEKTRLKIGGKITLQLDGSDSSPKELITDYVWFKQIVPIEEFHEFASGEIAEDILDSAGEITYKLIVKNLNEGTSSEATHKYEIYAPLKAIIEGPISQPFANGEISVELNGSASIGNITEYVWSKLDETNKYSEISNGPQLNDKILELGIYSYRLTVKDKNGLNSTDHKVIVFNQTIISNSILFFQTWKDLFLAKMNPQTLEIEEILRSNGQYNIDPGSLGIAPNKDRIVLSINPYNYGGSRNLYTFNTQTGIFEQIQSSAGLSQKARWNPRNNWIAYIEDGRYPERDRDEIALVNADTKELIYLAGAKTDPNDKYTSLGLSWNNSGDKLLAGNTMYFVSGRESRVCRLSIYSDLFSGYASRVQIHSEDYLKEYFGSDALDISEGISSVAWSPDGRRIAYNIIGGPYGKISEGYYRIDAGVLVIANADGSEIINILPDFVVDDINWSPDSESIIFAKSSVLGGSSHLATVDKDGNNLRDLNIESGHSSKSFRGPVWT